MISLQSVQAYRIERYVLEMGNEFFFNGIVPQPHVQEKIIAFARSLFNSIEFFIQPDPGSIYRTLFVSLESDREADYPFNYYGVIPSTTMHLLPHGQFIFDRTAGGTLVRLLKLPDSFEIGPTERASHAKECEVAIMNGGYTRVGGGESFALLLNVIKLRWCPDLEISDDCHLCDRIGNMIWKYGLAEKMANKKLDFNACRTILTHEEEKRHPAIESEPIESKPHLRVVDLDAIDIPIEDLELSVRTGNCIIAMQIKTVGDLLEYSAKDLLATRNFGRKNLRELEYLLEGFGLYLKKE